MFFLFVHGLSAKLIALLIFSLASLTDYFDGFFARKLKTISNFGVIMDPIADKVLVIGAFLSFVELRIIPAWMVVIIMFRELLITGLRIFALGRKKVISAARSGKHKTVSQMFTIFVILLFLIFRELALRFNAWSSSLESRLGVFIICLMTLTVILTTTSGISFLWQNRDLFLKNE
jgi:CDP-diacylglycerol--glycerol-3-phosphate 3-phosphatidyltransferase